MESLFEWHDVVFYAPLLVGVCLVLGSALGLVQTDLDLDLDVDADHDLDADVDGDFHADHGGTPDSPNALDALPAGKVPLILTLMTASLLFGSIGLSFRYLLEGTLGSALAASIALGLGLASTLVLTRKLTRLVARLLPSTETYATREHELIGQMGVAELDIDDKFGIANVHAPDGSLMKIRCRAQPRIAKGSEILVTDYEPGLCTYTVTESPRL